MLKGLQLETACVLHVDLNLCLAVMNNIGPVWQRHIYSKTPPNHEHNSVTQFTFRINSNTASPSSRIPHTPHLGVWLPTWILTTIIHIRRQRPRYLRRQCLCRRTTCRFLARRTLLLPLTTLPLRIISHTITIHHRGLRRSRTTTHTPTTWFLECHTYRVWQLTQQPLLRLLLLRLVLTCDASPSSRLLGRPKKISFYASWRRCRNSAGAKSPPSSMTAHPTHASSDGAAS